MNKKAMYIILIVSVVFLNATFSQDTIKLNNRQIKNNITNEDFSTPPFYSMSPYSYYLSNLSGDTIFYIKYLNPNLISKLAYTKSGIEDLWIATYKSGVIKEIGKFYSLSKKIANREKVGTWLYFSEQGELIEKIIFNKKGVMY